ncbi:MAG: ABC transporter substrate-binding protein [Treponema sp.]|nr:ABC transporter substrate-binding protein [Treponema sp.]
MKNILAAVVIILLTLLSFGCEPRAKQKSEGLTIIKDTLSIGVEIGYPPMEYYDTDGVTPIGYNIEMIKALAQKLGLKVNFIDTAWEGILAGLDANRYDVAVNITILPEREKRYNFTKPYISSSMTIVALKSSSLKIENLQDIAGYRVAFQGDTTAQYFTERLKEQGINFTSFAYDKILNCFDDLLLGRADLIAVDNIVAFNYAEKENSYFEVIWQGQADEYIGIALKKGNDALTDALNNALDELFADGTMQKIFASFH